jgi:hypothetical protein
VGRFFRLTTVKKILYTTRRLEYLRKHDGTQDHKHKGRPSTLERLQEACHRSRQRLIGFVARNDKEGVGKKMSDIKKEIKETVKGMAGVAFDAVERLTFQGSAKPEPKKPADK